MHVEDILGSMGPNLFYIFYYVTPVTYPSINQSLERYIWVNECISDTRSESTISERICHINHTKQILEIFVPKIEYKREDHWISGTLPGGSFSASSTPWRPVWTMQSFQWKQRRLLILTHHQCQYLCYSLNVHCFYRQLEIYYFNIFLFVICLVLKTASFNLK